MKFVLITLFVFAISVNSQILLQSNRYDYRNTTTNDFQDLAEFVVCGLDHEGLNDIAYFLQQIYLNTKQPNWQANVKMLFGRYWQNGSNYYSACSDPSQTLQKFAVRQSFVTRIRIYFAQLGLRQQISCVDEIMMRQFLSDGFGSTNNSRIDIGPKLIRMVFHDATDFNNLVDAYNNTYEGQSGVDFCLYSTLLQQNQSNLSQTVADPNHNRGLVNSLQFIQANQRLLANWIEVTDVEVLGALVALEDWFKGPKVNLKYGRKKGNCTKTFCIAGMKQCTNEPLFIKNSPASHHWSNSKNMDIFKQLGFTVKESISLIGAHTIGGVNTCTGFGNLNNGAYCQKNYPSQGFLDAGSFFDDTPNVFDNNYFKALVNIQMGSNNNTQFPECNFLNQMATGNVDFMQQQVCEKVTHCNFTNGRFSHMKNLRNVSYFGNGFRRLVSLPADWANIFDQTTLIHLKQFANNQTDFFNTFAAAYEKVSNLGYSNNELYQCQALGCSLTVDKTGFFCSSSFDDFLTFDVNTNPECSFPNNILQNNCQLVGGYGVGGQIQCGSTQYRCPLRKSIENQQSIQKFLNQKIW